MNLRRSTLVAIVVSSGILTACGTSPPPADEFLNEMIDTLDVGDEVKACMHQKADAFTIPVAANFDNLDDVASAADEGNTAAIAVLDELDNSLASCRCPE